MKPSFKLVLLLSLVSTLSFARKPSSCPLVHDLISNGIEHLAKQAEQNAQAYTAEKLFYTKADQIFSAFIIYPIVADSVVFATKKANQALMNLNGKPKPTLKSKSNSIREHWVCEYKVNPALQMHAEVKFFW